MSGIAGIYHLDGRLVKPEKLHRMVDILAHRGPDGADSWCDRAIGLGHRMLWSTPESLLEKLPFTKGDLTITADVRIDNRSELIPQLNLGNRLPEKITDSEVILAAYKKWGDRCPEKLLGDFAFAIWDSCKQHLFCARDHFGVKPFYYYASESLLVFATEIKALFCIEGVPRQLNKLRMGDYLLCMFHDTAMTSYQKILRLPPAHRMTASAGSVEISPYWSLDPNRTLPPASDEEYAAQLREIFTEAVNCRLRSAYPIGATLSGGLDSSSIACTARNLLQQKEQEPLHTFSSVFDSMPECDERSYTKPIFDQGGFAPHFVQGDHQTALENIEKMFWHQDEAFYAPNWFMTWPLYAEAQKQGVRIILDGHDGDSAVSYGCGLLSELAEAGRWPELVKQLWKLCKAMDVSFWKALRAYVNQYIVKKHRLLRGFQKVATFVFSNKQSNQEAGEQTQWDRTLNSEFAEEINMAERYQDWRKTQSHGGMSERQQQYLNLVKQGLESFALETADKTLAAFNIEPRYPFWDKRLIEFCLALPAEQKLHNGWTRVVMRRAMSGILPDEVQWRYGKTDFTPNLTKGLTSNQQMLSEALISLDFADDYIDRPAIDDACNQLIENPSNSDARRLWPSLSLALWIRYAFGEEKQPQSVSSGSFSKNLEDQTSREQIGTVM